MKLLSTILEKIGLKKTGNKTLAQYKEELLFKEGTEQFKALIRRGLTIPVQVL